MSAATSPDGAAIGPVERLHPLFLLSGIGGSLRQLSGAYAAIAYFVVSGQWAFAAIAIAALLLLMTIGTVIYWRRFEFRVGANDIRIDSGIFSRRHRSIPFDRIQDVDITQGVMARVLGLAKVKFDTGGSAGQGEDEGALHAISLERAQEIRTLVRSRRAGDAPAEASTAVAESDADGEPVYAMRFPRLLLAGVFNFSLAVFAGLLGLTQTMGDFVGFDPFSRRFWINLLSASDPVTSTILEHQFAAAIAGALVLIFLGLATGIVRTVTRDWGFRLDRTGVGLRRRRGLLTRTDVTLPVKRAQAVIVGSGPVRHRFGWSDLSVQSLAQDEGSKGNNVLAPLANPVEVDSIISQLGWRSVPEGLPWTRVSSAYIWMRLVTLTPLFVFLALIVPAISGNAALEEAAVAISVIGPILILLILLVGLMFARWFAWGKTSYGMDGDRLLVRTGWWRRRLVILPAAKIQSVDLVESFLMRWFGVASLRFGVAGGGMHSHSIPAIPSGTARQLREDLLISAV